MIVKYGLMDDKCFINYMKYLTNRVFKILPMQEEECETILDYMIDLSEELVGNYELIEKLKWDGRFLSLMGNIQYLIKDSNYKDHALCKKKVLNSTTIIEKLNKEYQKGVDILNG